MNQNESAAMWKSYSEFERGIAIQSTIEKLKESFGSNDDILGCQIKYKDYTKEILDSWQDFKVISIIHAQSNQLGLNPLLHSPTALSV